MKKKRIISALMAVSMCISAVPMAVCAENDTTTELPEFTQKFCDECLLNPEESEENRLIYNYFKGIYDFNVAYDAKYGHSFHDEFLGVKKDENNNLYEIYYLDYSNNSIVSSHEGIKCVQYISWGNWATEPDYLFDNSYITEEEFDALSYDDKYMVMAKIFDKTGKRVAPTSTTELYRYPTYVGEDGKGYNHDGEELDIVDGEIVEVPDIKFDNVDILESETLIGDANVDGDINMADAVLIMQSLSNPNEYKLSEQGVINADYNGDGGVTALDALEIQILMIS